MPRCKKIDHLHGLLPGVIETLVAHGCKIENMDHDEGTLRVPLKSLVLDWPEEGGMGLLRTPSGAYVMWCNHESENLLHFVGPAPWPDDSALIDAIQQLQAMRDNGKGVENWLKELLRLRLMRMMLMARAEQEMAAQFAAHRPPNTMIN